MTTRRLLPILPVAIAALTFYALQADARGKPGGDGGGDDGANANFAFVYKETLSRAIVAITIDGSQTQALTKPKGQAGDRSPTWSPDLDPATPGYQGKIAYLHRPDYYSLVADLFLINGDGSGNQFVCSFENIPLPDDADISRDTLAWSPNGMEIVFSASGGGFYAVEIATGDVRRLFGRPFPVDQNMRGPSISPLNMLAFDADGDIWVIDFDLDAAGLIQIDESSVTNLTADSGALSHKHASWSPDGTYLAFLRTIDDAGAVMEQLVVRDMLLESEVVVMEAADLPEIEATWSPDGAQIGVHLPTIDHRGEGTWDLFRITNWADPDARQVIPVTQPDRERHLRPSWNPGWEDL